MKYRWSDFTKDSVSNITGTILAQSIPILMQPVLRRIYSPEEFGLAAVYFSIITVLCVAVGLNFHSAIVLPKSEREAKALLLGSTLIALISSVILGVILFLFGKQIVHFFGWGEQLIPWLYLIPISAFLNSVHLSFGSWLTRARAYRASAINKVSRRFFESGFQLGLGLTLQKGGLLLGTWLGDVMNAVTYWIQFRRISGDFRGISLEEMKSALYRYIDFFRISLWTNLLSKVSYIIPILLAERLYASAITGQLDLGRQLLALPLSLITVGLAQVMLQQLSIKVNDNQSIIPLIKKVFLILFGMSLLMTLGMMIFGESLFVFIFGEEWRLGGILASWLVMSYALRFVVVPLSNVLMVLERLKWNSLWQLFYFCSMLMLFLIEGLDVLTWIKVVVLLDVLAYSIYGVIIWKAIRQYEAKLSSIQA